LDEKKRFSEEQNMGFLREADGGLPVKEGIGWIDPRSLCKATAYEYRYKDPGF
jgi:hypothetical protein